MNRCLWCCLSLGIYGGTGFWLWTMAPKVTPRVESAIEFFGAQWLNLYGLIPLLCYAAYAFWILAVERYSLSVVRINGRSEEVTRTLGVALWMAIVTVIFSVLPYVGGMTTYRVALAHLVEDPRFAAMLGLFFGGGGVLGFLVPVVIGQPSTEEEVHLRGSKRISFAKARKLLQKREPFSPFFGGIYLAMAEATQHFRFEGRTGAGKSFMIDVLLWFVVKAVGKVPDHRALIYDHKGTTGEFLQRREVPWKLFNPFDVRPESVAWDIQADCQDEAAAREIAEILLPHRRESQPFFPLAAQELFVGIVMTFISNGEQWDLHDVVSTLRDQEKLRVLLERTPAGRNLMGLYFAMQDGMEPKSGHDVRVTAFTYLGRLATVAAAWRKVGEKNGRISLHQWASNRGSNNFVLVLGRSHRNDVVMQAMYQVIISRIIQEIEDQADSSTRRTWVVFDEAFMPGRLPLVEKLMVYGRSKGVAMVWGYQSRVGLEKLYGREILSQILGQFGHRAYFRLDSDSAKGATGEIGDRQVRKRRVSKSASNSGVTATSSWEEKTEPLVMPSELSGLVMPKRLVGVPGFYMSVGLNTRIGNLWEHTVSWLWVGWMRHQMYGEQFLFLPEEKGERSTAVPIPRDWATSGDWQYDEGAVLPAGEVDESALPVPERDDLIIWSGEAYEEASYGALAQEADEEDFVPM